MGDGARISGKIEGLNQTLQITHRFMPDAAQTPYPAYKIVQIQYIATHPVGLISAAHQAILHLSPVSKESFDSLSINVLLPA
ncbi:hypothetical protein ACIAFW_17575 [Escherichia coli]|uniref:hypothetical protein n=1 Tax=Escherichia coli TaxID=562 RepID=UPI003D6F0D29